jgi:hypothetical protein
MAKKEKEKSKTKDKGKKKNFVLSANFVLSDKELEKLTAKIGPVARAMTIFDGGEIMQPAGAEMGRQTPLRINPRGFPGGFDPGGIFLRGARGRGRRRA